MKSLDGLKPWLYNYDIKTANTFEFKDSDKRMNTCLSGGKFTVWAPPIWSPLVWVPPAPSLGTPGLLWLPLNWLYPSLNIFYAKTHSFSPY